MDLLQLVRKHEELERELDDNALSIWAEISRSHPRLAVDTLDLFQSPQAAARWTASRGHRETSSPARLVAEGQVDAVLARLERTAHGFVG